MWFGCSKEPSQSGGSFEHPQQLFWLRNKKNNFQLCNLIWRPVFTDVITVKPVLRGHLKVDKTKVLKTNGNLMKVESIAEWSPWSILQYF